MVRRSPQPLATKHKILECIRQECSSCGNPMWNDYDNYRQVHTLKGAIQLQLKIRRCPKRDCDRFHKAYRPEAEGKWALPQHEFGLDVIAWVGLLRYQHHRSVPEIHEQLQERSGWHQSTHSEQSISSLR